MKFSILIASLIVFCFLLGSCEPKENNDAPFSSNDFPMKVGNSWDYLRTDKMIGNHKDTFSLYVNSVKENSGIKTFTLYVKFRGFVVDSLMATNSQDEFYQMLPNYPIAYFGDYRLVMPFEEGSQWLATAAPDSSKVIAKTDDFALFNESYPNTYTIVRNNMPYPLYHKDTVWVAKDVGLVKQYIQTFTQKAYYELISYHLN